MNLPIVLTEDYNYILPQEKIAQHPLPERDASKLLIYKNGECNTDSYKNIASFLPPNSLAVFNNSKVIPARIIYIKETAGVIELFCLEPIQGTPYEALQNRGSSNWICLIGGLKKWRKDAILQWDISKPEFQNIVSAKFIGQNENGFEIEFSWSDADKTFADILESLGQMEDAELRLTSLEHPLLNILAIVLITIGWSRHKKTVASDLKFKSIFVFYLLGLILIVARIPWNSWLSI